MDCDSPLLAAVSVDGKPFTTETWLCQNHRASKCVPCATRYRRRVETVAGEGMWRRDGFFSLLTLTAPGDRLHCLKAGCDGSAGALPATIYEDLSAVQRLIGPASPPPAPRAACSHEKCPCTAEGGVNLAEWNPSASKRWNHLLTLIERAYGQRPKYFRAVEVQDGKRREDGLGRGGLHLHVLVWMPYKISVKTVRQLAMAAGFGHSVDLQALAPGSKAAARYVAKYVSKSCDAREEVPWEVEVVDWETYEVTTEQRPATFRTWSQSKDWGTSMAAIRLVARRRWEQWQDDLLAAGQGLVICAKTPREPSAPAAQSPPGPS
jgi:hypothetical protein